MSRNSRVFTTMILIMILFLMIYMSRNSRVFTTDNINFITVK